MLRCRWNRWDEQGGAAGSLEPEKLLAEFGKGTFRASGTCMYPGVRPGDLLRIEPRTVRQIEIGEIAVFRRDGRFFAHRAIAAGEDARGPYIVTRPDRSSDGSDDPSHDRELLGVVKCIERKGRLLGTARNSCGLWARAYHLCCLTLIEWREGACARLSRPLSVVQQTGLYRLTARFWFARTNRVLDYVVHAPLHSQPDSPFLQKFAGREVDAFNLDANGHVPEQWTLTLRVAGRTAAFLAFSRSSRERSDEGWRLTEAHTRIRYRGTGVEEKLFQKAEEILARSGSAVRSER